MKRDASFLAFVVGLVAGFAIALTALALTADAHRGRAFPLHYGHRDSRLPGQPVANLQWSLDHNRWRIRAFRHRPTGFYGRLTLRAVRRAKYFLGYPCKVKRYAQTCQARGSATVAGRVFLRYLRKQRPLPRPYEIRRGRRLRFARKGASVSYVGRVTLVPGRHWPRPHVVEYVKAVSRLYGAPLVICSGWRYELVNSNRRSQHLTGNAADICTPTVRMNIAVGQMALVAAGLPRSRAAGVTNAQTQLGWGHLNGAQVLYGCASCGGYHLDHVHAGMYASAAAVRHATRILR